jgi:hypothetical protein
MARLRAGRLDDQLVAGADPVESAELAARAALLLRPRMIHALQTGLRRAVAEARLGRCARSSAVHVHRPVVEACGPGLLALAAELGDPGVRPQGVVLTRRLLCDGAGPLYREGDPEELRAVVAEARAAL